MSEPEEWKAIPRREGEHPPAPERLRPADAPAGRTSVDLDPPEHRTDRTMQLNAVARRRAVRGDAFDEPAFTDEAQAPAERRDHDPAPDPAHDDGYGEDYDHAGDPPQADGFDDAYPDDRYDDHDSYALDGNGYDTDLDGGYDDYDHAYPDDDYGYDRSGPPAGPIVDDGDDFWPDEDPPRPRSRRLLFTILGILAIATLVAGALRYFVFDVYFVPTSSMAPAIGNGDRLVVNRFASSPDRGDVVVVANPTPGDAANAYVRRVIGLPGDTVAASDGVVLINGVPLEEAYLGDGATTADFGPVVVSTDELFLLSDNRALAGDIASVVPVSAEDIIGVMWLSF
ncbi:MAG: signal peptidase I [Actinomycetota bacterium]